MALFDFFRRQLAAHRSNPLPQSSTVVPDGHMVTVYEPSPVRGLRQSTGCICIVDQGRRGDNPVAEMERLLREVGDLIRGDRPRVLLASLSGRVSVLVEVQRPEGVILSALPGRVFVPTQSADPYIRRMNEEKDRAEEQGDIVEQRRLEALELDELARRLRCTRSSCYR